MREQCGNGAGTLKQGAQTVMMQAVREGSECEPMIFSSSGLAIRENHDGQLPYAISSEKLQYRKICMRWVSKILSDYQKKQ